MGDRASAWHRRWNERRVRQSRWSSRFAFRGVAPAQAGKPTRIAFRGHADTKRADFAMTRDLVEEVGANATGFDVAIEIDAEALAKAP